MNLKNTAFVQSFLQKKDFLSYAALDIIYYILLIGIISFIGRIIFPRLIQLRNTREILNSLQDASLQDLHTAVAQIRSTYYEFWIYSIMVILVVFLLYTFIKSYFWHKVLDQQYSWKIFGRFCIMNLLLLLFFLLFAFLIITLVAQQNQVSILLLILYPVTLYIVNLLHPLLAKSKSIKKTIQELFSVGIIRCYRFILPYLLMLIIFIVLLNILILLQLFLPVYIYFALYLIVFVLFTTWFKLYLLRVIERNQQKA